MDWTTILITLIGSVATILTTIITTKGISKREKMHAAKQSILQMISEDKISYSIDKRFPENHQAILDEFDEYQKNGGNSHTKEKVEEYKRWYEDIQKSLCVKHGEGDV